MTCDLACAIALAFGLSQDAAQEHAWHAEQAADEGSKVDAELLLAVARVETNFRPRIVSVVRGKRFCGPVQAQAGKSKKRCLELQQLSVGYKQGAKELAEWLRYTKGNLPRALRGYACGVRARPTCGSHNGRKRPYDVRVLDSLRRIRARRTQ